MVGEIVIAGSATALCSLYGYNSAGYEGAVLGGVLGAALMSCTEIAHRCLKGHSREAQQKAVDRLAIGVGCVAIGLEGGSGCTAQPYEGLLKTASFVCQLGCSVALAAMYSLAQPYCFNGR